MAKPESPRKSADAANEKSLPARIPPIFFVVLALLWLALVWFPIAKINGQYTATINEGFATYQQAAAVHGEKVYGSPPKFVYQNYPPLSFHLVGVFGEIIHDTNVAGRWISLAAYLSIGVFIVLIVRHFTGSREIAALGGLSWLIWLAAFDPQRIGYNDPHMLGVAMSLAGFYGFAVNPDSQRRLFLSAAVFSLVVFTKPTLIAFPGAVAIYLFLTSRRRFVLWFGTCVGICLVLLGFTFAVDGSYFVQHQTMPRPYDPWGIVESLNPYLRFADVGLVAAILWLILRRPKLGDARMTVWALAISHVAASIICGGVGAAVNHFYDGMVCLILVLMLMVPELLNAAAGVRASNAVRLTALALPLFLTSLIVTPLRLYSDFRRYPALANDEAEFLSVRDYVHRQEGPAMCETLLICQQAGKKEEYDPYTADMAFRAGRLPQSEIVDLFSSRHFRVLQIEWPRNEPMQPSPRIRFTGPVMRAIFANYQLAGRTEKYALFTLR